MRQRLGTSSPKSSPETISSHHVTMTALMRGKLMDGTAPLAAAISHSASSSTMKPTPNQRVLQRSERRRAGLGGDAAGNGGACASMTGLMPHPSSPTPPRQRAAQAGGHDSRDIPAARAL